MRELSAKRGQTLRTVLIPIAAPIIALGVAIAWSLVTGTTRAGATGPVEGFSSSASGLLGRAGILLPLGYAFGAGMVSAVNPCGFAMLPAYLGLFLSTGNDGTGTGLASQRLVRGMLVGATVTAGFVVLFAGAGIALGGGARFLVTYLPWIGLAIGVALVMAGAWMLHGGHLYSGLGARMAARIGDPTRSDVRGYFLFGLSYGTASLSCTLPIFLTVIGGSIAVTSLVTSVSQFFLYALGMGSVILALTISIALFKTAFVGMLRRLLPYVEPAGAVLLLVAGGYIVYYWLTQGRLLDTFV